MQLQFTHHGAVDGVTGSCHRLTLPDGQAVLIDCGLFQGAETSPDGARADRLEIDFPLDGVRALVVTHVHIDHVGRIPYLLAAGFQGPIYCSQASAQLLPLVLQDALEVGFTRNAALIGKFLALLRARIVPLPYKQWQTVIAGSPGLRVRLQPAGHILGSAYAELETGNGSGTTPASRQRVVFSGDLGAPYTPLLPAPRAPMQADVVVMESTYGDRVHDSRKTRRARLQALCERAFGNGGTVLIPAFSIGRTQELLYELEEIIHRDAQRPAAPGARWGQLPIVVDSPLAADFTAGYAQLKAHWDAEARRKLARGRHPLAFDQVQTVASHADHLRMVDQLARSGRLLRLPGRRHARPRHPAARPARRLGGAGRPAHRHPRPGAHPQRLFRPCRPEGPAELHRPHAQPAAPGAPGAWRRRRQAGAGHAAAAAAWGDGGGDRLRAVPGAGPTPPACRYRGTRCRRCASRPDRRGCGHPGSPAASACA